VTLTIIARCRRTFVVAFAIPIISNRSQVVVATFGLIP
jgi:hypothetical protein